MLKNYAVVREPEFGRQYPINMDAKENEKELAAGLLQEGFRHTYVWQDGPYAFYPDHRHAEETAHVILSGEMTLILDGEPKTYQSGDRCDVPAGATHSARMGPRGCRYLIGER